MGGDCISTVKPVLPIPKCGQALLIICGVINFIIPGLGLFVAAVAAPGGANKRDMLIALCEFVTTIIILGWIWSIANGIFMILEAIQPEQPVKHLANGSADPILPPDCERRAT